jgi:hypothetical protein
MTNDLSDYAYEKDARETREAMINIHRGREHIAKMAEADGEHTFAREVRSGYWDHRSDVQRAIQREARHDGS